MNSKENRHPNRARVEEADFSKISKQYILEGESLKVKGLFDGESRRPDQTKQKREVKLQKGKSQSRMVECTYQDLQDLEQLGPLSQQEQEILKYFRQNNKYQARDPRSNGQFPQRKALAEIGHPLPYLPQQPYQRFEPYQGYQSRVYPQQMSSLHFPIGQPSADYHHFGQQQGYPEDNYY